MPRVPSAAVGVPPPLPIPNAITPSSAWPSSETMLQRTV